MIPSSHEERYLRWLPDMSDLFGVYVHVPWCTSRCPYCSFNVYVHPDPPYGRWRAGVQRDWRAVQGQFTGTAHSVFFGGGTPSLAPPAVIGNVLRSLPTDARTEVTVEANPGTITAATLAGLKAAGVNRVSVGVQTFDPRFAHLLSRGHTVHAARKLVGLVAAAGLRSWSVDIIFALPGQTEADIAVDLEAILACAPPHVSVYGLTIKAGTPFARAAAAGKLVLPDAETWRRQYDRIVATLRAGGWQRYEVSNFARPGHRAVHNEQVWRGGFYAGLGPGAHGFLPDGTRTVARAGLEDWLADPLASTERPSPREQAIDLLLTCMRHIDGLDLATLHARTRHRIQPATIERLVAAGVLVSSAGVLALTEAGWPLADGVTARLVDALSPAEGLLA